jgi:hypothetical protein
MSGLHAWPPLDQALGWTAAVLTLVTFLCRDMRRLRLTALAANLAFICYASLAGLWPVLALHLCLVPVNLWRLGQSLRPWPGRRPAEPAARRQTGARPRLGPRYRRRPAASVPRRHRAGALDQRCCSNLAK